ncbi:phospholipid carrier-dependent glycosyltransferase [Umezawaea endophytica]|uniref:Phospholipid carrier-dependent glycosyltransferase n=1 Tax=Umezawaea endophytica TaxID=1654476 RepID=A0A9X3A1B8_9PSEU|nr:phospholipid carrier-dependent glycosyltransferase [Umezawaea endophytica]MCS7477838.1 phospholipid carrier-dependent glycosyltransferase [Umezawaea endophytica]
MTTDGIETGLPETRGGGRDDGRAADLPESEAGRPPGLFDRLRRHRRWLLAGAVVVLLAQMAIAMVTTAVEQSPTVDESIYVGTSVVYLEQHSLKYNPEHPPLGKLIIAAGTALVGPHLDPAFEGHQYELAKHVLYEAGNDPEQLLLFGRLPVIVLTLLFGLVVFAFARELAGPVGGLVALALYAFSPDLIAHGSLATLDVPTAGFLLTSVWMLWRARRRPVLYIPLAALALGAALATKMSALAALPVLLPLVVLSVWHARRTGDLDLRKTARLLGIGVAAAVGVALVAIAVVWASYLAVDPRLRWEAPQEIYPVDGVRALVDWLPFPEPYLFGMHDQFGLEDLEWTGFLFGKHYTGSLWYYLPAALLVKTSLGALALWVAGAVVMLAVPRLRPAAPYVLVTAAVLLAAAMTSNRDIGVRYLVFMSMFLAVAAAGVVSLRRRWATIAVVVLVAFSAVSSMLTFPYYLPYSNEAFGGPANTQRNLHDSNVDWGQDLGRLAARLKERYPGERVWLAYQGMGSPSYYGIDAADPLAVPQDQVHGLLAVSASAAVAGGIRGGGGGGGGGGGEFGGQGQDEPVVDPLAELIASSTQIDEVGYSITIYRRP